MDTTSLYRRVVSALERDEGGHGSSRAPPAAALAGRAISGPCPPPLLVKPGLTGTWQVIGTSDLS
jgi:hypothetical protein